MHLGGKTHILRHNINPPHTNARIPIIKVQKPTAPHTQQRATNDAFGAIARADVDVGLLFEGFEDFDFGSRFADGVPILSI